MRGTRGATSDDGTRDGAYSVCFGGLPHTERALLLAVAIPSPRAEGGALQLARSGTRIPGFCQHDTAHRQRGAFPPDTPSVRDS